MKYPAFFLLSLSVLLCQTGCAKAEPDSVPDTVKVMHPEIPEYYLDHLIEKEEAVNKAFEASQGDNFSFVFFTDAHWGKNYRHSPAIIKDIVQNTPIKYVFFGGDVITTHSSDKNAMLKLGKDFQDSFSFLGNRFYCIYGNHDNNSDEQVGKTEYYLSESEVYSYLQSQMTNTNTTFDGYYNFFVDFEDSKTRMICLDTGRYYYESFRNHLPITVAFIVNALNSTPEGWHIVIASHYWGNLKSTDGVYSTNILPFMKNVLRVLDNYNNRDGGLYTYGQYGVRYDFTEARSHIDLCIGGHTHVDDMFYTDNGIPIVIFATDGQQTVGCKAEAGTISEQSVSSVVLDYKNNKYYFYRVGRGEDRVIDLDNNIEQQ